MKTPLSSTKFQLSVPLKVKSALHLFLGGTVVVLVIGIVWSLYWFLLAVFLEARIINWTEFGKIPNTRFSLSPLTRSNFPGTINLSSTSLTIFDQVRETSWHTKNIQFSLNPIAPTMLEIDLSGQHRFVFRADESEKELFILTEETTAHQPLTKNSETIIKLGKTSINLPENLGKLNFSSGKLSLNRRITVKNIDLPEDLKLPLGTKVQHFDVLFSLISGLPRTFSRKGVSKWQKFGGALELETFFINYGPLHLSGNGKITLTDKLKPTGTITLLVGGLAETIDALINNGFIDPQDAPLLKIGIRMLSKEPVKGDPEQLEIPISIQDGLINAGPFTLLRIPEITWPE